MFDTRHLKSDAIEEIYRQTLEQSEQAEAIAWINYVRAREARVAVERDRKRVTQQDRRLYASAEVAEKMQITPASHEE